jgi:hypothetical protein
MLLRHLSRRSDFETALMATFLRASQTMARASDWNRQRRAPQKNRFSATISSRAAAPR